MAETLEARVRAICMSLPEVTERLGHGAPAFFVRKDAYRSVAPRSLAANANL